MKKRILSILLAVVMLVGMIPLSTLTVSAAEFKVTGTAPVYENKAKLPSDTPVYLFDPAVYSQGALLKDFAGNGMDTSKASITGKITSNARASTMSTNAYQNDMGEGASYSFYVVVGPYDGKLFVSANFNGTVAVASQTINVTVSNPSNYVYQGEVSKTEQNPFLGQGWYAKPSHTHTKGTTYMYNTDGHWLACGADGCDLKTVADYEAAFKKDSSLKTTLGYGEHVYESDTLRYNNNGTHSHKCLYCDDYGTDGLHDLVMYNVSNIDESGAYVFNDGLFEIFTTPEIGADESGISLDSPGDLIVIHSIKNYRISEVLLLCSTDSSFEGIDVMPSGRLEREVVAAGENAIISGIKDNSVEIHCMGERAMAKITDILIFYSTSNTETCLRNKKVLTNDFLKTPATCDKNAVYYYSCLCGFYLDSTFEAKDTALGHDMSKDWSWDEEQHWHACKRAGCTETADAADHVDEDKNGICDVCEYYDTELVKDVEFSVLSGQGIILKLPFNTDNYALSNVIASEELASSETCLDCFRKDGSMDSYFYVDYMEEWTNLDDWSSADNINLAEYEYMIITPTTEGTLTFKNPTTAGNVVLTESIDFRMKSKVKFPTEPGNYAYYFAEGEINSLAISELFDISEVSKNVSFDIFSVDEFGSKGDGTSDTAVLIGDFGSYFVDAEMFLDSNKLYIIHIHDWQCDGENHVCKTFEEAPQFDTDIMHVCYGAHYEAAAHDFDGFGKCTTCNAVAIPTANTGLVYNSEQQCGVPEGSYYTISGHKETNVGNYTATAKLKNGFVWADGTITDKKITWEIIGHTHSFDSTWTYDQTGHWHPCVAEGCTATADEIKALTDAAYAAHDFTTGLLKDNGDGTHSPKCVCGTADTTQKSDHEFSNGKCACEAKEPVPTEKYGEFSYCGTRDYYTSVGLGSPDPIFWGIYIPVNSMKDKYTQLEKVKICSTDIAGNYKLVICSSNPGYYPSNLSSPDYQQDFTTKGDKKWMTITLDEAYKLPDNKDLWIILYCDSMAHPAAACNYVGTSFSAFMYIGRWNSASNFGVDLSWMIKACFDYEHEHNFVNGVCDICECKQIAIPTAIDGLVVNGETQTGVLEGEGYTLEGNTAKEAGEYTATATLKNGYAWSDGTITDKKITWSIASGHTHTPEWVVTTAPTADTEGLREYKCSECGDVLDSEVIPAIEFLKKASATEKVKSTTLDNSERKITVYAKNFSDYVKFAVGKDANIVPVASTDAAYTKQATFNYITVQAGVENATITYRDKNSGIEVTYDIEIIWSNTGAEGNKDIRDITVDGFNITLTVDPAAAYAGFRLVFNVTGNTFEALDPAIGTSVKSNVTWFRIFNDGSDSVTKTITYKEKTGAEHTVTVTANFKAALPG